MMEESAIILLINICALHWDLSQSFFLRISDYLRASLRSPFLTFRHYYPYQTLLSSSMILP
jgi:hypothetical protein